MTNHQQNLKKSPPYEPGPLEAKINGPEEVRLTEDGNVSIQLDGSSSVGDISEYVWDKKGPSSQEYDSLGQGISVEDFNTEIGTHNYRLTIKDPVDRTSPRGLS